MPLISSFYGLLIYIYGEKGTKHNLPHFHVRYGDYDASYDLHGNLIAGDLPPKKSKMVEVWASIHEEELQAAWIAWNESREIIKIEGLR